MSELKSHLRIGEQFTSLPYKGRKIEIARNQFGYVLIIDGRDISYGHVSVGNAEKEANRIIDTPPLTPEQEHAVFDNNE